MSTLAVNSITPTVGTTTTTLNTDTVVPTGKKVTYTDKGSMIQPGGVVQCGSATTGYGSGARLTTTSTSWTTIAIGGGDQRLSNTTKPSANVIQIDKKSNNSHLEITFSFPLYTYGTAGNGGGVRFYGYHTGINSGNAVLVDTLPQGYADYWGSFGYASAAGQAQTNTFTWRTDLNSNYADNWKTATGACNFYWETKVAANAITLYMIDYGNANPKYGMITWKEVQEA